MHRRPTFRYAPDVTPRMRDLLANERWFCDEPPTYEHMGTAQNTFEASVSVVWFLRKWAKLDPSLLPIAQRLDTCDTRTRCLSAACPMCARAHQRAFVKFGRMALRKRPPDVLKLVSLVHPLWKVKLGELKPNRVQTILRDMQARLARAGLPLFIGGFDLSSNWKDTNRSKSYFQLQLAGIAASSDWTRVDKRFACLFPKTKDIRKPFVSKDWDGKNEAIAYSLKPAFNGREWYRDLNIERDDRGPSRNTRGRDLRVRERMEVLGMLNQVGLASRQILRGARFVQTKNGPRVIVHAPMSDSAQTHCLKPQPPS
jgi:hypothetical protein